MCSSRDAFETGSAFGLLGAALPDDDDDEEKQEAVWVDTVAGRGEVWRGRRRSWRARILFLIFFLMRVGKGVALLCVFNKMVGEDYGCGGVVIGVRERCRDSGVEILV